MCRLFAFSFHKDTTKDSRLACVNSFKALSQVGAVLPSSTPGHNDGWGAIVYSSLGDLIHHHKSVKPAHLDETHEADLFFKDNVSQSGLIHLRKKTVGEAQLENTHPFITDKFSFIHNGTVNHSDAYPALAKHCEGVTDSERLFSRFLEIKTTKNLITLDAYKEMLQEARCIYPEHSALNTVLHDGNQIYVSRSINMNNKNFSEGELLNYYTLYLGESSKGDVIISSEKLLDHNISYTLLPNHSLSVITISNNNVETFLLN